MAADSDNRTGPGGSPSSENGAGEESPRERAAPSVRGDDSPRERTRREEQILDAAERLLLRWGYRKSTVDDVAREAGVGKGTIYLHWKDKNQMFQAVLWRASRQAIRAMQERLVEDPAGGQFHRLFAHGMVAVFANPLLSAIMSGETDLFRGLIAGFSPATLNRLVGNSGDQIARMQRAGLIRDDLSVEVVVFLIGSIKSGIISASGFTTPEQTPSTRELTDALGDLMKRWLEPAEKPGDGEEGRRIMSEWMDEIMKIGTIPTEE